MSWKSTELGCIAKISGGKRLPSGHEFSTSSTQHLYIRARDIGGGSVRCTNPVYIDDRTASILKRYTVEENDILITIVGANIGDVGFVTAEFSGANLTENAAKVTAVSNLCDPKYLKQQLATDAAKRRFQGVAAGSAQGKLGLYKIKKFDVTLPPIEAQRKIAVILSTYEDLIANNRRRIELLEQSTRLLFKEWFVHLRYPGHEHDKIVNGVPEGWARKSLGELITLHYGKALQEERREVGEIAVYGSSGEVGKHNVKLADGPGIVVGRKGNVGSVFWVDDAFWPIDTVYYVEPKNVNLFILRLLEAQTYHNSDAAVPGLNREYAYSIRVCWPKRFLREEYESFAQPIFAQRKLLLGAITKLTAARDLLLPRLMDGRIEV